MNDHSFDLTNDSRERDVLAKGADVLTAPPLLQVLIGRMGGREVMYLFDFFIYIYGDPLV